MNPEELAELIVQHVELFQPIERAECGCPAAQPLATTFRQDGTGHLWVRFHPSRSMEVDGTRRVQPAAAYRLPESPSETTDFTLVTVNCRRCNQLHMFRPDWVKLPSGVVKPQLGWFETGATPTYGTVADGPR